MNELGMYSFMYVLMYVFMYAQDEQVLKNWWVCMYVCMYVFMLFRADFPMQS
jgi:hypothetical protein